MESYVKKMINDIASELGMKCSLLSKDWIFVLEKDNKTKLLAGYKSSLNDHAVGMVIDDKYALFDVLKYKNIPVAEYNIVYNEKNNEDYAQDCKGFDYVRDYFYKHNNEIVLKPNDGTCGRDVYRINDINLLEEIYRKLTNKYYSINMGPYYHIKNEYRLIVLNNEIRIAYKKNKPVVYGDGVKTIRELLLEFNERYFNNKLDSEEYNRVLRLNEEYEYNWKFNLSQGAIASDIDDRELFDKLKDIALKASKEVGLNFGSVDIIVTENKEVLILEMNSGVMVDNYIEQFSNGYDNAKRLYKDVIIEMFKN